MKGEGPKGGVPGVVWEMGVVSAAEMIPHYDGNAIVFVYQTDREDVIYNVLA